MIEAKKNELRSSGCGASSPAPASWRTAGRRAVTLNGMVGAQPAWCMTDVATYPKCSICGGPLRPDQNPIIDDGAAYHASCMAERLQQSAATPPDADAGTGS